MESIVINGLVIYLICVVFSLELWYRWYKEKYHKTDWVAFKKLHPRELKKRKSDCYILLGGVPVLFLMMTDMMEWELSNQEFGVCVATMVLLFLFAWLSTIKTKSKRQKRRRNN